MENSELFVRLVHVLDNRMDAMFLLALLGQGADRRPFRTTQTVLGERYLQGALSRTQIFRSTDRLRTRGLISTRIYPKTWTEFTVNGEALRALLASQASRLDTLPGLNQEPIAFAETLTQAVSAEPTGTAQADAVIHAEALPQSTTPEVTE